MAKFDADMFVEYSNSFLGRHQGGDKRTPFRMGIQQPLEPYKHSKYIA